MIEHRIAYSAPNFVRSPIFDVTKFQNEGLPVGPNQTNKIYFRG